MTLWPGVMVDVFKDNGQGGVVPVNVHTLHWQWLQPLEIRWTSHNGGQSVVAMHAANTGMKPHFSHKLPGLPISEVHCTQLASGTIINATHTLIHKSQDTIQHNHGKMVFCDMVRLYHHLPCLYTSNLFYMTLLNFSLIYWSLFWLWMDSWGNN